MCKTCKATVEAMKDSFELCDGVRRAALLMVKEMEAEPCDDFSMAMTGSMIQKMTVKAHLLEIWRAQVKLHEEIVKSQRELLSASRQTMKLCSTLA